MTELKPCPFCACGDLRIYVTPVSTMESYIECGDCEARVHFKNVCGDTPTAEILDFLIGCWNRREGKE